MACNSKSDWHRAFRVRKGRNSRDLQTLWKQLNCGDTVITLTREFQGPKEIMAAKIVAKGSGSGFAVLRLYRGKVLGGVAQVEHDVYFTLAELNRAAERIRAEEGHPCTEQTARASWKLVVDGKKMSVGQVLLGDSKDSTLQIGDLDPLGPPCSCAAPSAPSVQSDPWKRVCTPVWMRLFIISEQDNKCAMCKTRFETSMLPDGTPHVGYEIDHNVALWKWRKERRTGDPNVRDNLKALCRPCHSVKTHTETIERTAAEALDRSVGAKD